MTAPAATDPRTAPAPVAAAPTPEQTGTAARRLLSGPAADAAWVAYRADPEADPRPLYALLGAQRLLAPAWPVAYGGLGLTPEHQAAVVDALVDTGVSETLHTLSVQIAGTFLLTAGSPAQRATLLPALAAGRSFCAVLYSEPDVGSDLAALATTADPDPAGGWRVTGRKVYSVKTHLADLALVAARTSAGASRYDGITLFCVPLSTPGVTVRALPSVGGERFADVTFDAVRVPDRCVVGPAGGAWPLITDALALERTGVDYHAKARRWLAAWHTGTAAAGGRDPGQVVDAARLSCRTRASGLFARRCLGQLAGGRVDPVLAALAKLWCAETARDVAWFCAEESGGGFDAAYREAPGLTISAGTSEMMLELVAGSGLPAVDGDLAGLSEEPLARHLRAAVRRIAQEYDEDDDPAAWWPEAVALDLFALDVPVRAGGLGLGLPASVIACEELGRGLLDGGALAAMATRDAPAGNGTPDPPARDRVRRAAWLVGLATGALAHTVRRARERHQFGRALVEHQSVAFRLARAAAEVIAVHLLVAADADDPTPAGAAATLAAASELALRVTREAMQLSGAYGMTLAAPAQRYYRAAMAVTGPLGPARRLWRESAAMKGAQ